MKSSKGVFRRYVLAAAAGVLLAAASLSAARADATDEAETESGTPRWVATWSAPPMPHGSQVGPDGSRSFNNQTIRQNIHISAGGTRLRVKVSNEYGEGVLIIGSARVALQSTGASIVPGSDRALKFAGRTSVVIPKGAVVLSDPVNMNVASNANLAISLYVPQNTGFATYHHNGNQTVWVSTPGDFSEAIDLPLEELEEGELRPASRYWLTFVEVLPQKRIGAFAIIGDSISEGSTTTDDANRRVTDVLSRWFNPASSPPRLAFLNQGTGCGRLLFDICGPSGLSRMERDVLNATGVTQVLIELGYGDIIFPTAFGVPEEIVSAEQIIAGLRQLVRQARMRGLKVYGATAPPNCSTPFANVCTPENEAKRQALNHWIRTTREFDAVADYDLALRDPDDASILKLTYDSGDGIHPNDAGHEALARAIVLSLR